MSTNNIDALLEKITELASSSDRRFLELGRLLTALKAADAKRCREYIRAPKTGRRRAYYLMRITGLFDALEVDDADLQEIGWTKLLRLAPFVNKSNVQELVAKAKTMTNRELTAELTGEGTSPPHALMFFLTSKELKLLTRHLKRHGAAEAGHGLQGKEKALLTLLRHYEQLLHTAKVQSA
jgi:hypothetical protein